MSQCDHLRPIGNRSQWGARRSPSIKMAVFVEVKLFLWLPSIKMAVFLEVKLFLRLPSRKKAVFLDGRWQTKKRHPRKDVSVSGVELGGLASTCCDVRTILQGALLANAVGIILAHNHPSGNVTPSLSDIKTTNQITKPAKLLDIQVLDHIIYTRENCYSFADDGQI